MKKSADILGLPIISITEGRELGMSKTLLIDTKKGVVAAITIEDEEWYRGVKLIPYDSIIAIGDDAITIIHSDKILNLSQAGDYETMLEENIKILGTKAITKTGTIQGKVTEIFVGENGKIEKCEIKAADGSISEVLADNISIFGKQVTVIDLNGVKKNKIPIKPIAEEIKIPVEVPAPVEVQPPVEEIKPAEVQPPVEEVKNDAGFQPSIEEVKPVEEVQSPVEEVKPVEETQPPIEEVQPPVEVPPVEEIKTSIEEVQTPVEEIQPPVEVSPVEEIQAPVEEVPPTEKIIADIEDEADDEIELPNFEDFEPEPKVEPAPEPEPIQDSEPKNEIKGIQQAEVLKAALKRAMANAQKNVAPPTAPPKESVPKKNSGKMTLIGKKAAKTITADNGTVIIEVGAEITEEVLQKARIANKFIELSMNSVA